MIRAEVTYDNDGFAKLVVEGHGIASGGYGKDIYCSAVSLAVIGAISNLEMGVENYDFQKESGYVSLLRIRPNTKHDEIVLETLIQQLRLISHDYPEHVTLLSRKEGKK